MAACDAPVPTTQPLTDAFDRVPNVATRLAPSQPQSIRAVFFGDA